MAKDHEQQDKKGADLDRNESGKPARDRVIGEGMTSLDSTQAPLKSETGEPDWDAMTDKGGSKNPKNASNNKS